MNHAHVFSEYLSAYADRDIARVAALLDDEVQLSDWNISVSGKAAVIAETRRNFESARSIAIEVRQVYEAAHSLAAELRIVVDGDIELHVVDVVQFNSAGKMCAIRAYRGRS